MIIDREYIEGDMAKTNSTVIMTFSILMFVLLILLLILTYNSKCKMDNSERFQELSTKELADKQRLENEAARKRGEFQSNYDPKETTLPAGMTGFARPMASLSQRAKDGIEGSDPLGNATYGVADSNNTNMFLETQLAGTCVARDRLTSADLLPLDANSRWAELNPQCSGDLQDQNYLTAGYHIGINTVGQSMRNANLQLRAEPPNPQLPVSPWGISTIEPDDTPMGLSDIGTSH